MNKYAVTAIAVAAFLLGDSIAVDRANRHLRKVKAAHKQDLNLAFDGGALWATRFARGDKTPVESTIHDLASKSILDYSNLN